MVIDLDGNFGLPKKKQSDLDFPSVEGKANWDMELIKQKVFLTAADPCCLMWLLDIAFSIYW